MSRQVRLEICKYFVTGGAGAAYTAVAGSIRQLTD